MSLGALFGLMLLTATQTASAADPMSGKWELNLSNSMYDPGPAPKSMVRMQAIDGDTITVTSDIVDADGQSRQLQYTAKLDGSDYPIIGALNADTIALKRIDARTLEFKQKKGGRTTLTGKHQVSDDGSELSISAKGKNAKGEEVSDLMVFDKR
ncbi:MAG TPA: hypothetical protein VJ011_06735 [Steroidobacteraceae bacterium]|nr:hypothetical protein [Steroidobacteraceae bacterium]